MSPRLRLVSPATGLALLLAFGAVAPLHAAEPEGFLGRATGAVGNAAGSVGDLVRKIVDFVVPTFPRDEDLDLALETYAKGHYFTTWLHARRLLHESSDRLADEASFLAGLAAAEARVREEAVPRLREVLDADPVSPYYPVALATLLEIETREGNHAEAARVAARDLADLWRRPGSPRAAAIKAIFLETGSFTEERTSESGNAIGAGRELARSRERATDRAMYLAGLALLRTRDFERASICFDAFGASSSYYPYARYGLAQASYGAGDHRRTRLALGEILSHPGTHTTEVYLRDRAALLSAQILHERDEDDAALGWLRRVSGEGPFGLHAALLAAQILHEREQPALGLVYLKDRPTENVEPKLMALAAALDARLHRDLDDSRTGLVRLEEGIAALDGYEAALRTAEERLDELLAPLENRSRSRRGLETWRRQNVANAVPDLVDGTAGVGWGTRLMAGLVAGGSAENGYPVVYYRRDFDPFSALPLPREQRFEPPSDDAFPSLFRRSFGEALDDALRHDIEVRFALEGEDPVHLAMVLLDGEIRLRAAAPVADDAVWERRIRAIGFGDPTVSAVLGSRPRARILAEAVAWLDAHEAPDDARLRETADAHLSRWQARARDLVRDAAIEEMRTVQELRYRLELERSQTLTELREQESRPLQGAAPTTSVAAQPTS